MRNVKGVRTAGKPIALSDWLTPRSIATFRTRFIQGAPDECWPWRSAFNRGGYGIFCVGSPRRGTRTLLAHRVSWFLRNGTIPGDALICHRCNHRYCVNPDHLYAGSEATNAQDTVASGIQIGAIGEAHGHSKLTNADVAAMRRLHVEGATQAALAERFGVTSSNVCMIVNNKRWTHVSTEIAS